VSDRGDLLLPEGACLLHIGPYKTGSTALQVTLHRSRELLAEHGVRYAGDGARAMRAGWGLIGTTPRGRRKATEDDWHALVREVHTAPEARVVVSTEDFGRIGPRFTQRVVADLGADRLHVLAVARRLDKLLPSQWQQRAQSFRTRTYEDYLRAVLAPDGDDRDRRAFWASHDVAAQMQRWADLLPAGRFTLLVADESDRRLLPHTLEAMLGLPDDALQPDQRTNPSLSLNGIELLRQVNETFAERGWDDRDYVRLVQHGMVPTMKGAPRTDLDQPTPRLPGWAVERVAELSEARAKAVEAAATQGRVRVLGDPGTLRTVEPADPGAPTGPPEVIGLEAVVHALTGVVQGVVDAHEARAGRARRRRGRRRRSGGTPVAGVPTRQLVREVASRARSRIRPGRTA
jgi:hypothetical protein